MDILENVNKNVSSMVTSSFDEFISTKVKEEVEKEKEQFLKDLNMCQEEYPVNEISDEFRIMGLSFPGLGSGHSERSFCYITNLGNLYHLPGGDTDYPHPHKLQPPPTPEVIKWRSPNNDEVVEYKPVKLNNEYIEILKLLRSQREQPARWNPLFFKMCDIYAKYHPRATENFVIEEKLKKLNNIEEVITDRVSQKVAEDKKALKTETELMLNEKENYGEKIKEINEEKLKKIFSMFILRNEKKTNEDDKNTIREMIKHTKERCNQREIEFNVKLKKERDDFEKEKEEFRKKVSGLIEITNNINEINEGQDDESCKSTELFNIIKMLKNINNV
jgi:hypothetical protein